MRYALTVVLFLAACGGTSKSDSTTPGGGDDQEEIQYEDMPADETATDETATDEAPPVEHEAWPTLGEPSCDELLVKTRCSFEAAGDAVPPESWKAMEEAIPAWRDGLANEQSRQATIDACKQALDAGKDGYAAQGC